MIQAIAQAVIDTIKAVIMVVRVAEGPAKSRRAMQAVQQQKGQH